MTREGKKVKTLVLASRKEECDMEVNRFRVNPVQTGRVSVHFFFLIISLHGWCGRFVGNVTDD